MAATAEDEFLVARTAGDGDGGQTGLTVLSQPSVGFVQAGTSAQPTAVGVPRKPNQLKALSRKTIAFQKRQLCTNICCICLCPLLMVAISALLGNIINTLIARSQTIEDILYCSNNNSLNSIGWPIYNASDLKVHGVNTTNGKSVNFLSYISFATLEDPGAAVIGAQKPCVLWFGNEYPQFSPIYERNANLTGFTQLDSTYIPPPDGGWIGQLQGLAGGSSYDLASFQKYTSAQQSAWSVVGADPSLTSILGSLPDGGDMTVGGLLDLNLTDLSSPTPYDPATGLLGTMPQRVYLNIVSAPKGSKQPFTLDSAHLYPYFITNTSISTADQVDDALAYHLRKLIADLASLNKTILQIAPTDRTSSQLIDFQIATTQATRQMPTSGLFLTALDAARARLRIVLSVGTDVRVSAAANYPSQGLRQLMLVAQLGQAALRTFGAAGENENLAKATVTQGVRSFPYTQSTALNLPFGGLIGRILYPFGVSFLLPIFVIMLVKEKEDRIYIMMKMNGVKAWAYYLSHYLTFFLLFVVSSLVFILVGRGTKLDLFTKTQPFLLVSFFFLWGNIQVVLAFLISSLFSKSRIALVMTFLVVLIGVVISLVLDTLFEKSWQPAFLNIWPPFAFYRGLSLMNVASYTQGVKPFGNEQFKPGTEFHQICTFLFLEIFVFGALAAYMNAVIPTEFGIPRPWHFPITDLLAYGQTKQRIKRNGGIDPTAESAIAIAATEDLDTREDDDVRAERVRVDRGEYTSDAPIVMSHMKKVYPGRKGLGPKIAVRDVTFAEERGVIFGLLGPNGAGKTTLINILTGLYESSAGEARLAGFDVKTETASVYNQIGVCPQFDILWEDLTIEEHLYFYARLKGVGRGNEAEAVQRSLEQVSLTSLRKRLSKNLSGGEKRRLSIAIALVGDPAVVFLDEPTTGLDPEVRRLIWNIIQGARDNKTIILTTHSMEEAEALCQRIGIMAKGSLRCVAQPLRLKELYGTGFKLSFHSLAEDMERASLFIESVLPSGWKKIIAFSTNTAYEFPAIASAISTLFEKVEAEKGNHGILQWGISQTTLEEVFLRIISDDDANAD